MPEQTPARPVRRLVAWSGGVIALAGTLMLLLVILSPPPDAAVVVFAVLVTVVPPLGLGIWLLHRGAPSLLRRLRSSAASLGTTAFWRSVTRTLMGTLARRQLIASPIRRAALGVRITTVAFGSAPKGARWVGIFAAITIYSFTDPAINAFKPRWWLNARKCLAGFIVLTVLAVIISEVDDMREVGRFIHRSRDAAIPAT